MDDNQFLNLPKQEILTTPEEYQYNSESRPYKFTKIYKPSYGLSNSEDKKDIR